MNDKTKKREFCVTVKTHSGDSYIFTQEAKDRADALMGCHRTLLDGEFFVIPTSLPPVVLHPTAVAAVEVECLPVASPGQGEGEFGSPKRT